MKEIASRPAVYNFWKRIEKWMVPKFPHGYTVNGAIAAEFKKMYGVDYSVVRNMPRYTSLNIPDKAEKYILYQGAVNEGRSFETLIPAMKNVNHRLMICGDGNFMKQAKQLVREHNLQHKIHFTGRITPSALAGYTQAAWIGVTLFDNEGLSNFYSLANRFFDYMHAGVPQLCVDYPVYRAINDQYKFALLTADLSPESLANHMNELMQNQILYSELQSNCLKAREILNWNEEEKVLVSFYQKIIPSAG
jgi:glycosyltransferase involved in cell wall biosynthesis